MKKALCYLLICFLLVSTAGCTKSPTPTTPTETDAVTTPVQTELTEPAIIIKQQPLAAISVPAVTETTTAADGTAIFNYTYQNMSLILQDPDVADKVILDFLNRVDETANTAESIRSSAETAYNGSDSWIPYICNITYSPMRIDHGVLSLFAAMVTYSGASHPERTCVAANYDLVTGDVLTLASIMSVDATADDFRKLTVSALEEIASAKYLYEDYEKTVQERFSADTSMDENWYFTQRGLCFYFAPYEIAPYSSGVITVEIPYERLTGLLYDGYFPAERSEFTGTVTVAPFEEVDMTQFTQIAEAVLQRDAEKIVLYTDTVVQDVRLSLSGQADTDVYTPFAAFCLTPGDAVVIDASQEQLAKMKLSYLSDGQTVTVPMITE